MNRTMNDRKSLTYAKMERVFIGGKVMERALKIKQIMDARNKR